MKRSMTFVAAIASLALLGACESSPKATTASASAPINTKCPVGGEAIDSTVTTSYNGKTVGFCCNSCKGKWDKMTAEKQSAALAAVTK